MPLERFPQDAKLVVLLFNPVAGRRPAHRRVEALTESLRRQGLRVEVSTELAEAADRANREFEQGHLRCFVGAGGDGTAGELVNRVAPGLPLCFYPTGTSNLVASYLGMRKSVRFSSRVIEDGYTVRLDAGVANGRLFLAMASCGFDAAAVEMVHRKRVVGHRGGRGGFSAFLAPICRLIGTYPFPEMRVEFVPDGSCQTASAGQTAPNVLGGRWVFIFNLPKYGWGLPIAPQAAGTDGLLDLCIYRGGGFWKGLWYTITTQFGLHKRLADFQTLRGTSFHVTAEDPVPYQLDGDPAGYLPLEVTVAPQCLQLVVPRSMVERLMQKAPLSTGPESVKGSC